MTPHVVYATPDMTNDQGLTLMTAKHIRHLPVIDGDDLVGMVSIGDLVRSIISEQKEMISQLEQYILHYTSITWALPALPILEILSAQMVRLALARISGFEARAIYSRQKRNNDGLGIGSWWISKEPQPNLQLRSWCVWEEERG